METAGTYLGPALATALAVVLHVPASANDLRSQELERSRSAGAELKSCSDAEPGATCEPDGMPLMLEEYHACSQKAAHEILPLPEAVACAEAGLAVKLSFIAAYEPRSFRELPLQEQVEMNLRAYMAYRHWLQNLLENSNVSCSRGQGCGT